MIAASIGHSRKEKKNLIVIQKTLRISPDRAALARIYLNNKDEEPSYS